jgi:hypothetical protein
MHIETLKTPHPADQAPGVEPEPFVDVAGVLEAQRYLLDHPDSSEALFQVIDHVTDTVRETVHYYQSEAKDDKIAQEELHKFDAIEGITREQTTHCAGFAIVGSETLDAIGIEHYVGYMSGHWFLLVPYEEQGKQRIQLVDMYKSEPRRRDDGNPVRDIDPITQDITVGLSQPGAAMLVKQLREGGRAAAKLDFNLFAANLGSTPSTWENGDYRWLDPYSSSRMQRSEAKQNFIMTAYAPAEGREVATRRTQFRVALARGENERSAYYLSRLADRYPEVNARAPHHDIGALVMGLCAEGNFEQAGRAIDNYFRYGHSVSRDPRLSAIEGDLWRHVTKAATQAGMGAENIKDRAHRAYEKAAQRTGIQPYQAMCIGKMATL